jgi:DNA-binding response OmpR family regulator
VNSVRILVIEDDRKVANFNTQTGLEQEGCAVDVLHDGGGAGEQARAVDYDGRARPDAAGTVRVSGPP